MSNLSGIALSTPAAMAFWRRHSRIRAFHGREIEACGLPALVVTCEAVAARASLELVFARDSLRLLSANETGGAA